MEFKSQICTTVEQSKRLLELGLKKETADMYYQKLNDKWIAIIGQPLSYGSLQGIYLIPAWSLHRLMELATTKRKVMLIRVGDDLYDILIEKIRRMIADGVFNQEYLENKL